MIHLNQAASLALIYRYRASKGRKTIIDADQVTYYEEQINRALLEMNSRVSDLTPDYLINANDLFFYYVHDMGASYYVLKDDEESINKRQRYILSLPLDIVLASQKAKALKAIDLTIIDGEMTLLPKETPSPLTTKLSTLISKAIENPNDFYKKIGQALTSIEREYIKSLIDKSCNTCSNGCCRVEQVEKPVYDCIGWENDRIVGEYRVLKLNKKGE